MDPEIHIKKLRVFVSKLGKKNLWTTILLKRNDVIRLKLTKMDLYIDF